MTKEINKHMTRRQIMGGVGVGSLAAGLPIEALAGSSRAVLSDYEKKNEELVTQFCKDWGLRDINKLIPYLSEKIEYHVWEGGMTVNGHEQFRKGISQFIDGMKEIRWEIHRSTAMGDIVLNERTDYFLTDEGKDMPGSPYHIVGVFLVREGKIIYWKDYNLSQDKASL